MTLDPITLPLHVINLLAKRFGYKTYLELGVRWKQDNFDLVEVPLKHGVDIQEKYAPTFLMSSDEFFRTHPGLDQYDLIYVDDDHRELPALRSMANAVHHLAPGGTVVCDNVCPEDYAATRVTESCDAWKAWALLRMSRPDLFMFAIDIEYGCGVIQRGQQELFVPDDELPYKPMRHNPPLDFAFFTKHRDKLLKLVPPEAFCATIEKGAAQ